MTSKKTTRRALLSSAIALLLCVSMLVGSTFAWFTDEVTSTGNIIKSGTLDVEMQHSTDKTEWKDASQGAIFDYKFWEPGYTQIKYVKVINKGDLAFQYQMNIIPKVLPTQGEVNLADVIDVYMFDANATVDREAIAAATPVGTLSDLMGMTDGAVAGILLPAEGKGSEKFDEMVTTPRGEVTYCVVLKMQEEAGNEYQDLSVGEGFKVQLNATQYTWEEDSFDHMYDEQLPNAKLEDADEFENVKIQWNSYGKWSPSYPNDQMLETVYVFTAPHDGTTVQNSKYKDWYCDFVVSLDQDTTDTNGVDDLFLGGNYGSFGWVGFEAPAGIPANEEIPLLGSVTTNPWTYGDVATYVGTFTCGVARTYGSDMSKLAGATFTVKLRLTNPADETEYYDVETVKYTFSGAEVETTEDLATLLTADKENISVVLTEDVDLPITSLGSITAGSGEYKLGGDSTKNIIIDLNGHTLNITTTYWSAIGAKNDDATITIKNGSMTSTGNSAGTWNGYDVRLCNCNYVIENVVFEKAVALDNAGKTTEMKNVTINETKDNYALWITAEGQNVVIDGLTVNTTGRGIKIDEQYVDAPAKVTLKIANSTFTTAKKAAIMVKSVEGADITVSNVNIANVAADSTNTVWVDSDAAAYADKVTVTGATVIVEP